MLKRLVVDDDRIAVWRDVRATTNGAKMRAADVDALTLWTEAMTAK